MLPRFTLAPRRKDYYVPVALDPWMLGLGSFALIPIYFLCLSPGGEGAGEEILVLQRPDGVDEVDLVT